MLSKNFNIINNYSLFAPLFGAFFALVIDSCAHIRYTCLQVKAIAQGNKMAITMISSTEFNLEKGGHNMTLTQVSDGWEMATVNAAVRAYNNGYAIPKHFPTLQAVENKYKSWRGIAALAA